VLLSGRDWVYLLSLLLPLVVYNVSLKVSRLGVRIEDSSLSSVLELLRSDLLFNLGYATLWIGLFALVKKRFARGVIIVLFHLVSLLVALVTTAADQYFKATGSTLDYGMLSYSLSTLGDLRGLIASEVTLSLALLVPAVLLYAVLGPLAVTKAVSRWRGWPERGARRQRVAWLRFAGVGLVAYALLSLSFVPGGSDGASKTFSRDAFANVLVSGTQEFRLEAASSGSDPELAATNHQADTRLAETSRTGKRNVVMVYLESTRARSVTPYNEDIQTTPFMDRLADESLMAEKAYATVPHTTNALTAGICGIDPPTTPDGTDSLGDSIPSTCLPELLGGQGYNSVYFTSSVQTFERRPEVVENMGYDEFYPVETMDKTGFEKANYFGYEDNVMLEPSRNWLEENGDEPFFATYETITPHDDYQTPSRYGMKDFAEDEELNRYQNSVRYTDFFLRNLFRQYKEAGLYEDTVFVIMGDHGEAFGEHGVRQHDDVPYEEGLKIPMFIHDPQRPGWLAGGARVEEPANQLDILPTVANLLGYRIQGGEYPGSSLLALPEDRALNFSCWGFQDCLASLKDGMKYIYYYGNKPPELYDLSEDPLETDNIADKAKPEYLDQRRTELLEWRARVEASYER
jgi:phosphoglycerol transferase MdoB-like AlkP superfamily enzyme